MTQKIALITGANKGIGLETARKLAETGMHVILAGRQLSAVQAAAAMLNQAGLDAEPVALDVTDAESIAAAARFVRDRHGRLDVLVNNAGVMQDAFDKKPSEQSMDVWRSTFNTNVFGLVAVTNAFLPLLVLAEEARVVNVSSVLGSLSANTDPASDFYSFKIPAYNVSKSAVNAWTIHLAYELRDTGIKVNAAHPGFVKTDLHGVDAPMSPAEGAVTSVELATLPKEGPTGGFFHAGESIAW